MARSQWHRFYTSSIQAPTELLFLLLSDLPKYGDWLPGSAAFGTTTDVEPYPVRRGTRYHDGKPDDPGKDWWGTVTAFQPPGSVDFHHMIHVSQLRATVDVHIHYSLEQQDGETVVSRWLVLDVTMPRMNGLEACRLIQKRQMGAGLEVLFVTQHDSPQMMREALDAGARGYVVKSNAARDLLEAVEAVSQHRVFTALARSPNASR